MEEKTKRFPVAKMAAPNHRPRTRTYPAGEAVDPEVSADRYELFYQAFCLTGGSVPAAYDMTVCVWDHSTLGEPPTKEGVQAFAKHHDWRGRFLSTLSDPAQAQTVSDMGDAMLLGMKMLALETLRDVALGHAGDSREANSRLKGAQTIMFLERFRGPTKNHGTIRNAIIHTEEIERGNDDLSEEEITRRIAEDWEREKASKAASKNGTDGGDTT